MQILDNSLRDQIGETFVSQKQFSEQLRKSEYKERLQILKRFEEVFRSSFDEMYEAAAKDFCRPKTEVDMTEIMVVLSELAIVRKNLKKWMKPKKVLPTLLLFGTCLLYTSPSPRDRG